MDDVTKLIQIARDLAQDTPGFLEVKGPGKGDRATFKFMKRLGEMLAQQVPTALPQQRICGENKLAVDFYIERLGVLVEIAMLLKNSNSEFERDILKAVMAVETGRRVNRLVFISKPGAIKRHQQPSSRAFIDWALKSHNLKIEIHELGEQASSAS